MNFFKKITRKATTDDAVQQLIDFLNIGGVSEDKLSEATYFACLKILGESLGKLPLKLLKSTEKNGVTKAYEHPLYDVAGNRPNPYMTATHFWSTTEYNRNEYGNAYIWIKGAGTGLELYPLPAGQVQIWIDDKGIWGGKNAIWYIFTDSKSGNMFKISYDSILHFKGSTSFDGIKGKSVREILSSTLEGNMKAQLMLNKAYENGFTGKAVLQYTGNLNDENEKLYSKKIESYVKGDSGLEKIIPMAFGTSLTPINTKLADNEFLGLKKYSALQIAAAFGIKPNQINDYEKSSYAAAEQQQLSFYIDTLLYILKQYEEELSYKLLSQEERNAGYFFKFNVSVILRADQKTQIETLAKAVQGGIYTPNEARAFIDRESKPGGDELYFNGNMIPVTDAGKQYKEKGGE